MGHSNFAVVEHPIDDLFWQKEISKMKVACLLLLVALAASTTDAHALRKRFIELATKGFLDDHALRKRFIELAKKGFFDYLFKWVSEAWDSAKDAFLGITDDITFEEAVNALKPYIHSDMTVHACKAVCVKAAKKIPVLRKAAPLAPLVCAPACMGVLAELELAALN